MDWTYNEWKGDENWDDKTHAVIEALRKIAEQIERLNDMLSSKELQDIWNVRKESNNGRTD